MENIIPQICFWWDPVDLLKGKYKHIERQNQNNTNTDEWQYENNADFSQ